MNASIKLGRIWGIPVSLHASWFIIFGLITWSLATGYFVVEYPNLTSTSSLVLAFVTSLLVVAFRRRIKLLMDKATSSCWLTFTGARLRDAANCSKLAELFSPIWAGTSASQRVAFMMQPQSSQAPGRRSKYRERGSARTMALCRQCSKQLP